MSKRREGEGRDGKESLAGQTFLSLKNRLVIAGIDDQLIAEAVNFRDEINRTRIAGEHSRASSDSRATTGKTVPSDELVCVVDVSRAIAPGQSVCDAKGVHRMILDPTIPIVAEPPLRAASLLAEWILHNIRSEEEALLILPADGGVAHFAVAQRAQQIAAPKVRIAVYLTEAPALATVGRENMLHDTRVLEFAAATRQSVERADLLVLPEGFPREELSVLGWHLPPVITATVTSRSGLYAIARTLAEAEVKSGITVNGSDEATLPTRPHVTVCVTHHDRPQLLLQTLASIERQRYPSFDVVLVDDGSTTEGAHAILRELEPVFLARGWKIIRQENRYLGAARNAAAKEARGDWLLFIDDDDCMRDGYIDTFVHAAVSSHCDIATCFLEYFEGMNEPCDSTKVHHRWVMTGPAGAASLISNTYGGANAIIRKSFFHEIGGYTEDHGIGFEDWEFYNRACTREARFEVIPRPLLWCRWGVGGMQATATKQATQHARASRPVREAMPTAWQDLPALAQGLALRNRELMASIRELESSRRTNSGSEDPANTAKSGMESSPRAGKPEREQRASPGKPETPVQPVDPSRLPERGDLRSAEGTRVYIWHTEGLGLSGILSWMWRLRDHFAPPMNLDLRFVDLAALPYDFAQTGDDPTSFYDERIATPDEFTAFLRRTADDVHVVNHAFDYLNALTEQASESVLRRFRFVGVCHTDDEFYYANLARLAPILRTIVAVSPVCAMTLAKRIPEHAHKIITLPAWAVALPETRAEAPEPGEPLRMLYTGRVIQFQKRVFDLTELALHLKKRNVNATLTVAGDGPDLMDLREYVERRADTMIPIAFEPARPPWEMSSLLESHHIFVQVSRFEGASVSLMEALSYGLVPVVTATRSGSDLLRSGHNCFTARVGDMKTLASHIAVLAGDRHRLARMAAAARKTAEDYLEELAYPERLVSVIQSAAA